jgi:hypothetical protein
VFALLLGESCQKDTDVFIPTTTTSIPFSSATKSDTIWEDESKLIIPTGVSVPLLNIEKLINAISPIIVKDSSISAEQGGEIELGDDMNIEFPSNACLNKNNQPCKGKLNIEYLILRTKGELIAFDKPTVSLGRLLISGGAVYLAAKQNGQEVHLSLNKTIKIRIRAKTIETGMSLFEGKSLNRLQFDWIPFNILNRDIVTIWEDSPQEKKGYQLLIDRLGWINCDKFNDEPNLTNKFCVAVPDSFTNRNTSIYVAFKDINSVVKLEGTPSVKQFCIPTNYKGIPIGRQVSVVAIANIDGRNYIDIQDATVAVTNNIKLKPLKSTADEIKKKILNL